MTPAAFRQWAARTVAQFAQDGLVCTLHRRWADEVRPFDAALADLYVRAAEANEAIRAHLARRAKEPTR